MSDITQLLLECKAGDKAALDELLPLVYKELRQIASRHLARENTNQSLQPTELVHEAYLKLVNQHSVDWSSRAHFFSIAAETIRRILLNHFRDKKRQKRGDNPTVVELTEAISFSSRKNVDLIKLDEALTMLEQVDALQARIIELKFFGGLTNEDVAEVLKLSESTIKREWRMAKAWLLTELEN